MSLSTRYLGVVADARFGISDPENHRGRSFVSFESKFLGKPRRILITISIINKFIAVTFPSYICFQRKCQRKSFRSLIKLRFFFVGSILTEEGLIIKIS